MSQNLKKIAQLAQVTQGFSPTPDVIRVNESVGKAAFYYEKLRNAIDWQDEHLFLKNAIKRILKRRIYLGQNQNKTAEVLLKELIWAKYFKNESIPTSYIEEVSAILKKYAYLKNKIDHKRLSDSTEIIIGLAACEIEHLLLPSIAEEQYIAYVRNLMKPDFKIPVEELDQSQLDLFLKVNIFSKLFKADNDRLRYYLLKDYFPTWPKISRQKANELGEAFPEIISEIDQNTRSALSSKIAKMVKHRLPPFRIIWDIIKRNPNSDEILFDNDFLSNNANQMIRERNKAIYKKVFNSLSRGIIFILLTKIILALIIELPYEVHILGEANYLSLGINIIFPPLLMLITGVFIKIPGAKNTTELVDHIKSICLKEEFNKGEIKTLKKRKSNSYIVFDIFYTILSLIILALVVRGLLLLDFNSVSIVLFFFFTSLVSFLGFRISAIANELEIRKREDSFITGIYNLMFMPFVVIGRFLSDKWSSYNFTLFFWDFIVEAPFKAIISVFESWLGFMREKREDFE